MALMFSEADRAFLRRPHISRVWFAELDLPSGLARMHSGSGRVTIGGYEWRGVTDPFGYQMLGMSAVEDPRFGQAAKIDVTISGVNVDFLRSVKDTARDIEGRRADVYWCAFDQETAEPWAGGMKKLFPGYMSAPAISWTGIGMRSVRITIESLWQSQNYPFGGKWSPADLKRRYPGAKGLDYVGVKVQEIIKS